MLLPIRAPQIVLVRGISTPLLWAWGKPMLLWPEELSDQLSPEAKQGVLLHELAHLKRKDHWVGRLELVAGCLWWPNPLFWYVRHQLRENAELACDAWVVQTLPNGRRDYADALLTVCQNYSHPAVPLPALGMGKSTRRTLERRLTMILRDRVPFRVSWWGMIAVLLLGFLTLPGWSQSKEEQPKDEQSKQETPQLPEAESKYDVTDELTEPPADVAPGSIQVPVVTSNEVETIIRERPAEKSVPTDRVVFQRYVEDKLVEEFLHNERVNPNTAHNRELRLLYLEKKLQSLLGELQQLRGDRDATSKKPLYSPLAPAKKKNPLPKKVNKRSTLAGYVRSLTGVAQQQEKLIAEKRFAEAQAALLAAQRQKLAEGIKQRDLAKARRAMSIASLAATQFPITAAEKQAEVVETKTITLVRTTYRITRVDAKSLEELIRKIVKADFLQIQIADYVRTITDPGPYGDPNIKLNLTLKGYEIPSEINDIIQIWSHAFTVTTTPEQQEYIGRLIGLIEKAPRKEVPRRQKPSTTGKLPTSPSRRIHKNKLRPEPGPEDRLKSRSSTRKR